ncbi:MAG TPA: asparagine synthase (glutamine-hydrolyzing) [Nitrospiraceae bacterium]|nr:asparagine synthase (glutamine-hydrolyzing) [Nitrospiraceae bacterium]
MCGIGGVFLRADGHIDVPGVLEVMQERQHHRGPDSQGMWYDPARRIGLCHTRLAILDLSSAGQQPMQTKDGMLMVVFNGEIYNWREIRQKLEAHGVQFYSQSDTEVLLEAYRYFGLDVVQELRGMFAFALLDHRTGTVLCARDPVGKKPFVYAETQHGVAFASEIPALLAMPACDTTIHRAAVASMLLHNLRHIPDPHTAYCGLKRLRPGHAMLLKDGKVDRIWRYWTPRPDSGPTTTRRLRELLEESVALRMVADVPVGALLSGGVDSSAVVHLMQRGTKEPIRTYALGFDRGDEDLKRARLMAGTLGCIHKEFYFEPDRQLTVFQRMLETYGEPIMLLPLIHTHELCRAIHDDGMKVVLCGHGADELFYGYTGHLRTTLLSICLPWLAPLSPLARLLPKGRINELIAVLSAKAGARKAALYRVSESEVWDQLITPDVRHDLSNLAAEEMEYWGSLIPPGPYIDESNFVALMIENTHSVQIASDLPAMMASIEMRAPFLDQRMVSFALATHFHEKVPSVTDASRLKQVLKTAVADIVPPELLYAPKRGFGMGIQERMVLEGPWKRFADEIFAQPDDCEGLFVTPKISELWHSHETNDRVSSSLVAKLLAIQVWRASLN